MDEQDESEIDDGINVLCYTKMVQQCYNLFAVEMLLDDDDFDISA